MFLITSSYLEAWALVIWLCSLIRVFIVCIYVKVHFSGASTKRAIFSVCSEMSRTTWSTSITHTVKPVLNTDSEEDQKSVLKTDYYLIQVKSSAECSKGRILQYL